MDIRLPSAPLLLLAFGLVAFCLAGLSVADMFVPRPYDGVILAADKTDRLIVHEVVRGSGAHIAGLRKGDQIVGIGREALYRAEEATRVLNDLRIGDEVPYLVKNRDGLRELTVTLGRRHIADGTYLYVCMLGFSFFFVGLFVLVRRPTLVTSQLFFLLGGIFLLFLVCRMRPPSYSGVDTLILGLGTVAFLLLPPAFLHFYLLFPRPAWFEAVVEQPTLQGRLARGWRRGWPLAYLLPPLVFAGSFLAARLRGGESPVRIAGAPAVSWWLLALYMVLGLAVLSANARRLREPRERRGMAMVVLGSLFGLVPFLVSSVAFATQQHSRTFFFLGIMPLVLVPITFTYAIVRFQLLEIRVILRRSLLYTVTTAFVTGLYATGIAAFNAIFRGTALASSVYFPIVLALAIVLLFEPLRRWLQKPIDRFFFAERTRLQGAILELGEEITRQVDLQPVIQELAEKLPRLLDLDFAAFYIRRGERLTRVAGPSRLPAELPYLGELQHYLRRRGKLTRIDQLGASPLGRTDVAELVRRLDREGVEAMGELVSRGRHLGLVVLSEKRGQIPLEPEELDLLQGLLRQAALALDTSLLLEERTHQAELERELEIAAGIQARLLPGDLRFARGWRVSAACRPARIVGGDFFTQLPAPENGNAAVVFGDVSGKSVSGALMMMAAHEVLHTLALTEPQPGRLFELANRRVYALGQRNFVALGYFCASADGECLRYLMAGQPPPVLRQADGRVSELPLAEHRLPVGALARGGYRALEVPLGRGEIVLGYSDGVTEARSPTGDLFASERLLDIISRSPGDPDLVVKNVLTAIDTYTGGGVLYDDLTLVAVGRPLEPDR